MWDLFVTGLVLSGADLIKTAKSHMRSICQELKSQVLAVKVEESCASYASCFRDSGDPRISLVREFLSVTYLPIIHTIYTLITHRNGK